jgi:hypothetical protein
MSSILGGSSTQGQSSTSSTQPYIMSGLTPYAANEAASAQIGAAQAAAQAATQNTTSAINALMGQYSTALTYANPTINTGNQASAQENYMLGLPAVNPGAAPTAPTMGQATAPSNSQIQQYIQQNSTEVIDPVTGQPILQAGGTGPMLDYTGQGAVNNINDPGFLNGGTGANAGTVPQWQKDLGMAAGDYGSAASLSQPWNAASGATQALEAQQQPALQAAYNQAQTQYQQQLGQYNQQQGLYNQYQAQGQATPTDISDIVSNLPGFQFAQQQGINGIQNAASASGQLNSGNLLESLNQYGQGISQQYYQNYMGNLNNLAQQGTSATNNAMQGATNVGNSVAGAYTNQGNAQANSDLAAGQAMASSYTSPVANQQVVMTPYTTSSNTSTSGSSSSDANVGGLLGGAASISSGGGLGSVLGGFFSSKELKTSYGSVNTKDILAKVDQMTLDKWSYKTLDQKHIGPYAEEFKELFEVGDGKTINMIDLFGVMLGSIKELSAKVKELQEHK